MAYRYVHCRTSDGHSGKLGTTQEIAWNLGGTVAKCEHREYGFARVQVNKFGSEGSSVDALFEGLGDEMEVRQAFLCCAALDFLSPLAADRLWVGFLKGVDVSRRSTLCAATRFSYHRPYQLRTLCCHRAQREAALRYSISPRGDALPAREGGHLPVRAQHLWLQTRLDYGAYIMQPRIRDVSLRWCRCRRRRSL